MVKSVSIDGQTLHGTDRFGSWVTRELEGWTGPAPKSAGHSTPPGARVAVPGKVTHERRQITVSGRLAARTVEAAHQARDRLAGLLREPGRMDVTTGGRATYRTVRDLDMDDPVLRGAWLVWQLTVTALDGNRYGAWADPVPLTPGQFTEGLYHQGNAESYPLVTVSGSSPSGYTIEHTDGTAFDVLTPLSGTHTVDMATGQAYRDGAPVDAYGRTGQIAIHPGTAQGIRLTPRGGGSVAGTITVQDTWT